MSALMASILQENFGGAATQRKIVFSVYDLATRCVHVPGPNDRSASGAPRLADALAPGEDFRQFSVAAAGSAQIRALLGR